MTGTNDLTTLMNAKQWIAIPQGSTVADAQISRLITSVSQTVLNYLDRDDFLYQSYTEVRDGTGTKTLLLRRRPVVSISQLLIDNAIIPLVPADTGAAATYSTVPPGWGYRVDGLWDGKSLPGRVCVLEGLGGVWFTPHRQNISITYTAGYVIQNESMTPVASSTPAYACTPASPYGPFCADNGVTYANGTALTKVSSNPSVGQYSVLSPTDTANWMYQFSSADANQAMLASYSFVPSDVEQCVLEILNDRMATRSRPGVKSISFPGEQSLAFDTSGLPAYAVSALAAYRRVTGI